MGYFCSSFNDCTMRFSLVAFQKNHTVIISSRIGCCYLVILLKPAPISTSLLFSFSSVSARCRWFRSVMVSFLPAGVSCCFRYYHGTVIQNTLKIGQNYSTGPRTRDQVSLRANKWVNVVVRASEANEWVDKRVNILSQYQHPAFKMIWINVPWSNAVERSLKRPMALPVLLYAGACGISQWTIKRTTKQAAVNQTKTKPQEEVY